MKITENQKNILQLKIKFLNKNTKSKYQLTISDNSIELLKNNIFLTSFCNMADDNREDQAALYAYYYLKALCENITK